ncbi:MAG: DedA family protein [Pseudonocardiaceae bacterium]|nr:DedA family protein [Pseudonocardiaceae bacterium]
MDVSTTTLLVLFAVSLVPLVPTEVALVGMGVAAAQQDVSVLPVIAVAAAGCLLSDQVLYLVGRYGGMSLLDRVGHRPAMRSAWQWLTGRSEVYGQPILVVARWLPGGGTVGALLAGTLRWSLPSFVSVSALGVALWCTYVAMVGYLGGQLVTDTTLSLLLSLAVAVVLGSAISLVMRTWTRTRARAHRAFGQ